MLSEKLLSLATSLEIAAINPAEAGRLMRLAVKLLGDYAEDAAALENTPVAVDFPTAARDVPPGQPGAFFDHRTMAEADNVVVLPSRWPQPPCDGGAA
jgi:hypothetical protein